MLLQDLVSVTRCVLGVQPSDVQTTSFSVR